MSFRRLRRILYGFLLLGEVMDLRTRAQFSDSVYMYKNIRKKVLTKLLVQYFSQYEN